MCSSLANTVYTTTIPLVHDTHIVVQNNNNNNNKLIFLYIYKPGAANVIP